MQHRGSVRGRTTVSSRRRVEEAIAMSKAGRAEEPGRFSRATFRWTLRNLTDKEFLRFARRTNLIGSREGFPAGRPKVPPPIPTEKEVTNAESSA